MTYEERRLRYLFPLWGAQAGYPFLPGAQIGEGEVAWRRWAANATFVDLQHAAAEMQHEGYLGGLGSLVS